MDNSQYDQHPPVARLEPVKQGSSLHQSPFHGSQSAVQQVGGQNTNQDIDTENAYLGATLGAYNASQPMVQQVGYHYANQVTGSQGASLQAFPHHNQPMSQQVGNYCTNQDTGSLGASLQAPVHGSQFMVQQVGYQYANPDTGSLGASLQAPAPGSQSMVPQVGNQHANQDTGSLGVPLQVPAPGPQAMAQQVGSPYANQDTGPLGASLQVPTHEGPQASTTPAPKQDVDKVQCPQCKISVNKGALKRHIENTHESSPNSQPCGIPTDSGPCTWNWKGKRQDERRDHNHVQHGKYFKADVNLIFTTDRIKIKRQNKPVVQEAFNADRQRLQELIDLAQSVNRCNYELQPMFKARWDHITVGVLPSHMPNTVNLTDEMERVLGLDENSATVKQLRDEVALLRNTLFGVNYSPGVGDNLGPMANQWRDFHRLVHRAAVAQSNQTGVAVHMAPLEAICGGFERIVRLRDSERIEKATITTEPTPASH